MEINFGLLEPTDEMKQVIEAQPPIASILRAPVMPIEVVLPYPKEYQRWYDQKRSGGCVGFSWSIFQSTNNYNPINKVWPRYDAAWTYNKAQLIDNDPRTKPQLDNGTYLFAGAEVLRRFGLVDYKYAGLAFNKRSKMADPKQGILDYWWLKRNLDEITLVFAAGRPVEFGIMVYEGMTTPYQINGEWWFNPIGRPLGLHGIAAVGISYQREAILFANSWGKKYPPVWCSFDNIEFLLKGGINGRYAELMTVLDVPNTFNVPLKQTVEMVED
jgi:hypothetical protein